MDGRYECTFADDFEGEALDRSKWTVMVSNRTGFRIGPECFIDHPATVRVSEGRLHLSDVRLPKPMGCRGSSEEGSRPAYTPFAGGMVSTRDKFSQTYGRFEVRAAFPRESHHGAGSAIWMWPQTQKYGRDGMSGEIDLVERYSGVPDVGYATVKYRPRFSTRPPQTGCEIRDPSEFHTYTLEWTSEQISIWYDDRLCLATQWDPKEPLTPPAPFDHPMTIVLSQALGFGNTAKEAGFGLPVTMLVDHVRVWQLQPGE